MPPRRSSRPHPPCLPVQHPPDRSPICCGHSWVRSGRLPPVPKSPCLRRCRRRWPSARRTRRRNRWFADGTPPELRPTQSPLRVPAVDPLPFQRFRFLIRNRRPRSYCRRRRIRFPPTFIRGWTGIAPHGSGMRNLPLPQTQLFRSASSHRVGRCRARAVDLFLRLPARRKRSQTMARPTLRSPLKIRFPPGQRWRNRSQ